MLHLCNVSLCQPHDLGREGTENYYVKGYSLLIYRFLKISHRRNMSYAANQNLLILAFTDSLEVIHSMYLLGSRNHRLKYLRLNILGC